MSCGCHQTPCACRPLRTKCDRDRKNNVWVERGDNPGSENAPGICLLDTLTEQQVIDVVERDDRARADLLRVTNNERLRHIAATTPRLPTAEEADMEQSWLNRNDSPASIPFYGIFRGQPPFAQ